MGEEFIKFLAALAILPRTILNGWIGEINGWIAPRWSKIKGWIYPILKNYPIGKTAKARQGIE